MSDNFDRELLLNLMSMLNPVLGDSLALEPDRLIIITREHLENESMFRQMTPNELQMVNDVML